jgi:cellulose synthase/poly-beta-1,6-N-acetylglucosamine synthase-like glycosyltransferase
VGEKPCICVIICSVGRPECLAFVSKHWLNQSAPAHRIVYSVVSEEDLPDFPEDVASRVEVLMGPKGSSGQRNRALDLVLPDSDIIAFFDDDYIPSRSALHGLARAFDATPEASGLHGKLLEDGARGPGLSLEDAERLVVSWDAAQSAEFTLEDARGGGNHEGLYGCNMAFRSAAIRDTRFDERLPLYAWQEDIDFSSRIPGKKMHTRVMVGVHCGVKSGREKRGDMLGYSQIANPIYLRRKGSMSTRFAVKLCVRNFLSNHVKLIKPEPWIDRRGRMRGNWRAIADLLRGRLAPERILDL